MELIGFVRREGDLKDSNTKVNITNHIFVRFLGLEGGDLVILGLFELLIC